MKKTWVCVLAVLLMAGVGVEAKGPPQGKGPKKAKQEQKLEKENTLPKGLEKQRAKKAEQVQKELDKGSEQGQAMREQHRRKWWKFWGDQ